MRSDVFGKSSKFHTDNVFEWSLYGDFPGLLGQLTSVTYPRRTGGKRLASSLGPRDPKRIGLGTKGPTIWLSQVYISLQKFFLSKSVCWIFFSEITHTPPHPPPPPCQMLGPCNWMSSCFWHTGRGLLPYKRLMGMCRWMGSHFHDWIDYNGVAFSIVTEMGSHMFGFLGGKTVLHMYG